MKTAFVGKGRRGQDHAGRGRLGRCEKVQYRASSWRCQRSRLAGVGDPWGDRRDDRWYVEPSETRTHLVTALREQGEHTPRVVQETELSMTGAPGPRWDGADPASLERVLFHLLQEYGRHLEHLDIVVELAAGSIGE